MLNGYRQFDPTRGTHYIVDILFVDEHKMEHIKRAELMRPLGKINDCQEKFNNEVIWEMNSVHRVISNPNPLELERR